MIVKKLTKPAKPAAGPKREQQFRKAGKYLIPASLKPLREQTREDRAKRFDWNPGDLIEVKPKPGPKIHFPPTSLAVRGELAAPKESIG